ncbi:MAG: hypothetical protein HUU15_09140 [Candidatus Brocadiae bacterium]|nr:hypothetical protein [Candidatus Brocadiia bacterium]
MNASKILCILLLLAGSVPVLAGDPRLTVKSEEDRKVVSTLESMKVSLNFTETPLEEVIDFFREIANVNILLSRGVRDSGSAHEISLKVDELRAADALGLMVQMVDLTYKIEDGVILIITKDERKADTYLELYDVRDLLFHLRDFKAPEISLSSAGTADDGPLGITVEGSEDSGGTLEDPTLLLELIKNHTAGSSWHDNPRCSAEINNGILVVVQTKEGHGQVSALIEKLRQYK